MDASAHLWDRKQHRIDYFGDVRLLSPSQDDSVVAQAENLSEAGVFVTTQQDAEVGAEVVCELPLAADDSLTLRGRVAWVRPATPRGVGIEFVDVSEAAALALREVIGPPRQPAVSVKVRFEGMPEPVRAEALTTESGICLRTALPFLRLNSPVEFAFTDGEGPDQLQGWLQDVSLQADWRTPVPRLQVQVAQQQPYVVVEDAPDTVTVPQQAESTLPSVLIEDEAMIVDEMIVDDEQEAVPLVRVKSRPTLRNSELTEQLLPACADERFASEELGDPCERSHWDFDGVPVDHSATHEGELPGMNPEDEDLLFWQRSSPPRRRVGLWVAALSMLAIALASAHVTGFLGLAGAKLSGWVDGAWALVAGDDGKTDLAPAKPALAKPAPAKPALAKLEPAKPAPAKPPVAQTAKASPKAVAASKATPKPEVAKKPAQTSAPEPTPAKPQLAAKAKVTRRGLALTVDGSTTKLTLPIAGSLRGKRSYALANPDGLVVRLPNARSQLRHGTYKLRDGALRVVWIKRHERGVRFRVLYRQPRPNCKLAITRKAVLVRCREARKLASR
jgi:hypothetical protein